MTEFIAELRHYCRNPKCRLKLKAPVSNAREAFCARGCHSAFYRKHCRVCECDITQPSHGERKLCKKPKCRSVFALGEGFGRYHEAADRKSIQESPINIDVSGAQKSPSWRLIAGPGLTPSQLHCATVPDGPGCQWKGGAFERIEAQNRALLKAHFAKLAKDRLVQPNHLAANIQGGYRSKYRAVKAGPEKSLEEIRDRVARGIPFDDPDAASRGLPDPIIPGIGYGCVEKATAQHRAVQLPDDLSIPAFLQR